MFERLNALLYTKKVRLLKAQGSSPVGRELALKMFNTNTSRSRLLRSRNSTPNSVPDSPRSLESRTTRASRPSATSSPIKPRLNHLPSAGYDSDDSIRLDRANHTAMKQDIISIKTMLLKLRRVLNESKKKKNTVKKISFREN
ncbi:hypothetical protein NQ318_007930 [Aromia moschata]|uniref:Uncharacterized protein n=1 Tax=Aromia moschata TaxID=1265417 RepID=A0AAV8Y180_9CUCU|nr:hypothetical protein NQ318_007930 [Aromia moschata]